MHIGIDKETVRVNDAVAKQIVRCHKEGWQLVNIASICGVKPQVVQQVLKSKNML